MINTTDIDLCYMTKNQNTIELPTGFSVKGKSSKGVVKSFHEKKCGNLFFIKYFCPILNVFTKHQSSFSVSVQSLVC